MGTNSVLVMNEFATVNNTYVSWVGLAQQVSPVFKCCPAHHRCGAFVGRLSDHNLTTAFLKSKFTKIQISFRIVEVNRRE